ncbi:hypothetical protein [Pseudomonas lopnurensis]|uniref:hypothetical protein n=1 Tax=Pseudomonas lopnurensis TaxID=1477517 RepID=UPI0028A6A162|nr:hypothetical protein [Pseudomonas lopnurensis]
MKQSDGFDARRLRPRGRGGWPLRLGAALGALLAISGTLLTLAGLASLLGRGEALGALGTSDSAFIALVLGLIVLLVGVTIWRSCRRRLRQPNELSMARHLLKKRD